MKRVTSLVAALALAALTTAGASAAQAGDLSAVVPGHPGLTAFDLIKLMAPDLAHNADGSATTYKLTAMRHLEGKDADIDLTGKVMIADADVYALPGDASRVVVVADLGAVEGYVAQPSAMALIALTPTPHLLDAVQIGSDRFVAVDIKPVRMVARGSPLILVDSDHFNSNEDYLSTAVAVVRHDRFVWVDSVFTFNVKLCSWQETQSPVFTTVRRRGALADIHVRVDDVVKHLDDDCGGNDDHPPKPHKRQITGAWRWDARKGAYVGDTKALDRLEKENQTKF
jgi:hypothetical protein